MILAELFALLGISGGLAVLVIVITSSARRANADEKKRQHLQDLMANDLKDALWSRDYRKLDDWLVLYADEMTPRVAAQVKIRRDELFIEKNP